VQVQLIALEFKNAAGDQLLWELIGDPQLSVGEPSTHGRRQDEPAATAVTCDVADTPYGENLTGRA